MRVLIDACVLYPTVMREMVMGAAGQGLFTPLWSPRILEEWARAAARMGPDQDAVARAEISLLRERWPDANVRPRDGDLRRLWLPDQNDIHVFAAAIAGRADVLLTMNNADFPRHILSEEGLRRDSPDLFLLAFLNQDPDAIKTVATRILTQARTLSDVDWTIRRLMKKARLPRLGKALDQLI
ncbi:RSP_2648 family PIN domain-containing protein [Aliiroseovarius sediminis]|uniref:RSP_2648 family PIN domain-containing protein n=1 Tax=Aliiroseovarius sediminis TaxID=2925839 RepID=UPI001F5A1AA9|nr:PIN domain-containing protein [Aliiroseovarius sediminis]MCI2393158.1 PIN domain-containing protein [Aliiroseovarius sediminis]